MYLLTSIGLSERHISDSLESIRKSKKLRTAGIIINAHKKKLANKYCILTAMQLKKIGYTDVQYIDLNTADEHVINSISTLIILGGNTFLLQQAIEKFGKEKLYAIIQNKVIVGISAGAIVLTPTIRIASEIEPDDAHTIESMNSLSCIPYEVYPHYTHDVESEIQKYEKKYSVRVLRLHNEGSLLFQQRPEFI